MWSPDGRAVAICVVYGGCGKYWHEKIVVHDLVSGTTSTLWEPPDGLGFAWLVAWEPSGTLVFLEKSSPWAVKRHDDVEWRLDVATGARQ
jgi:hypothetical protein